MAMIQSHHIQEVRFGHDANAIDTYDQAVQLQAPQIMDEWSDEEWNEDLTEEIVLNPDNRKELVARVRIVEQNAATLAYSEPPLTHRGRETEEHIAPQPSVERESQRRAQLPAMHHQDVGVSRNPNITGEQSDVDNAEVIPDEERSTSCGCFGGKDKRKKRKKKTSSSGVPESGRPPQDKDIEVIFNELSTTATDASVGTPTASTTTISTIASSQPGSPKRSSSSSNRADRSSKAKQLQGRGSVKGTCLHCDRPVLATEKRLKCALGYLHAGCAQMTRQAGSDRCLHCCLPLSAGTETVQCGNGAVHQCCLEFYNRRQAPAARTAETKILKGKCAHCQLPVFSTDLRVRCDAGYLHDRCMARFKVDPAQLAAIKAGHLTPAPSPVCSPLSVESPHVSMARVHNGTTGSLSPRISATPVSPVASPVVVSDGAVLDRHQIKILSDNQL